MTAEEWALVASVFFSGLAAGLLGMLSTIMRPMLAAMSGRDFRGFMGAFLRYADDGSPSAITTSSASSAHRNQTGDTFALPSFR